MIRVLLISVLLTACEIATDDSGQESSANGQQQPQSQVSPDREAVDRVITNSPVTVTPAEVCEIKPDTRGVAACNLPGKQALRIQDVGTETLNGYPNPQYSPVCAFWLEPTVERLFDAGEHFRRTMLSAEQLEKESRFISHGGEIPELRRCQIPEFEAMKTRLINGSIAPGSQYTQLASGSTEQEKSLPPVKPSFFKKTSDIGRPSASAEELSAQYQIPYRISILNGPSWGWGNEDPTLMGAWDIGTVISQLARPVYEVVIDIDGKLAVDTTDARTERLRGEEKCDGDLLAGTGDSFSPRYLKTRPPWLFFRLAVPPNLSRASVVVTKEAQSEAAEGEGARTETTGEDSAEEDTAEEDATVNKVTTTRIDLDGDGIDDLAVWDDGGAGEDLDYRRNILIYANVGGSWYLLDKDEVYACGC